jgi:sugar lactone lactonase YvrE
VAGTDEPRPVSTEVAELGEGARWDPVRGELLWVDIPAGVLRRAVEDGDGLRTIATVRIEESLGAVTTVAPDSGGGWLLAAGRGFRHLAADDTVTALVDTEPPDVRMNDAACDPQGRFWAGSMAYDQREGAARVLRCDPDGAVRVVLSDRMIANGLGWSPDGRTLYHADTGPRVVTAYPFDPVTGELGAGDVIIRPEAGGPDGLLVDDEGALWVALHGAGEVRRYGPDGATLAVVRLPVSQPTSVAIGGASGRRLFVTTAWESFDERQRAAQPDAGRVFAVDDVGVTAPGLRPFRGLLPRRLA